MPHPSTLLLTATLLAAAASADFIPPLPPVPPPPPQDAQQPRPEQFRLTNSLLQATYAEAQAANLPPVPITPTPGGEANAVTVNVGCNYNVAGPPLNWHMWCAPDNATITEWYDAGGARHRKFVLAPQPGLTSDMVTWYTAGLSSPVIEYEGAKWYWYSLWHPIDHVEARNRILLPPYKDDVLNVPRRFQTEIYEIYQHAPASYTGNVTYGTQAWFDVLNPVAHAAGKSSNIGIYLGGYLAFTLTVETEETPAGAVLTIEVILGAPLKGFDPLTPDLGYTQPQAEWINTNIMLPMYVTYIDNMPQRSEMWNMVSRHVVEEFSNLGRFLPVIYYDPKANPLALAKGAVNYTNLFSAVNSVPIPRVSLNKTGPAPDPPVNDKKAIYLNPPGPPRGTENPKVVPSLKGYPPEGHQ